MIRSYQPLIGFFTAHIVFLSQITDVKGGTGDMKHKMLRILFYILAGFSLGAIRYLFLLLADVLSENMGPAPLWHSSVLIAVLYFIFLLSGPFKTVFRPMVLLCLSISCSFLVFLAVGSVFYSVQTDANSFAGALLIILVNRAYYICMAAASALYFVFRLIEKRVRRAGSV